MKNSFLFLLKIKQSTKINNETLDKVYKLNFNATDVIIRQKRVLLKICFKDQFLLKYLLGQ